MNMDVNGCHVIPEPIDTNPEGFSTTVHRGPELRGPFATIGEAINCALTWTASTNQSLQLEPLQENPPLIEDPRPASESTA